MNRLHPNEHRSNKRHPLSAGTALVAAIKRRSSPGPLNAALRIDGARRVRPATLLAAMLILAAAWTTRAQAEPSQAVLREEARRIEAMRGASACTIAVFDPSGSGGGSAVVISPDGYALTNFHVTNPVGNALKCGMSDGVLYDAVIVGLDPSGDIALIKLLGRDDFPHSEIADSDQVRVGDWCFTAGNPFLLAEDFTPSIAYGIVSGVHRYQYGAGTLLEYADCIQTDAAINPGNSGGPLFNGEGQLIGINGRGSFEKRGRVNVGVGYAVSTNQITHFLGYLKSGRIVDHATLGATVTTDVDGRVVVDEILEDSDAYRRGLRYDDEIIAFGGREIRTVNGMKNALGIYPRGWRVPLSYRREGNTHHCMVRLMGVHHEGELEALVHANHGPPPEKPKPKEEPQPDEKPKKRHLPQPGRPAKIAMPKVVAEQFEARPGYANYHFNRQHQDRVWNAFVARGDFSSVAEAWTIEAELVGGGHATMRFDPQAGAITLPVGEFKARFTDDLEEHLTPPRSGGLLVALHIWQRLLLVGPKKFGEVYYLGTMPLTGQEAEVDVLVGIYAGLETRFYFSPADGHLVGLEMMPDDDVDPAEVYFADYREVEGRALPHHWEVRHGGMTFAAFEIKQYRHEAPAEQTP